MKEEARRFSLNDYMGSTAVTQQQAYPVPRANEQTSAPGFAVQQHYPQHQQQTMQRPSATPVAPSKLTFSLNAKHILQTQSQPAAVLPMANQPSATLPSLTFNLPRISRTQVAADAIPGVDTRLAVDRAANHTNQMQAQNEDVMRLSAQLEESREKLNRMHAKLQATEQSVARANQALVSERTSAQARMTQLVAELRVSRDAETKLKQELANSPKRIELERTTEAFKLQAEGALKLEEEHATLRQFSADLEAKMEETQQTLRELTVQHESLVAEHESTCKALGLAQEAVEQGNTDECCKDATGDDADSNRPSLEEQQLKIDAAVASVRAETNKTIDDLNVKLAEAIADSDASKDAAVTMAAEREKIGASKSYCEELLTQSAQSLQAVADERDEAQNLLRTTQDALTAELPNEAMVSLKDYTDAAIEAHRLAAAQPTVHTAASKSELVHAEQRASKLFETLATGVQSAMVNVSSDQDAADLHSIRKLKQSVASSRYKHYVDSQSMVPMTAAMHMHDVHPDEINEQPFDTDATASQTEDGRMVIVVLNEKKAAPDLSNPELRVQAAVSAISGDMKRMFTALRAEYHKKVLATGSDTGHCTDGYMSSSSEDSDDYDDENADIVAVHPADDEAASADA
jgi:hypothetical protein